MNKGKVYETARNALQRYDATLRRKGSPVAAWRMLDQIVDTAYATGHWELWFQIFENKLAALLALKQRCIQAHNDNTK